MSEEYCLSHYKSILVNSSNDIERSVITTKLFKNQILNYLHANQLLRIFECRLPDFVFF